MKTSVPVMTFSTKEITILHKPYLQRFSLKRLEVVPYQYDAASSFLLPRNK